MKRSRIVGSRKAQRRWKRRGSGAHNSVGMKNITRKYDAQNLLAPSGSNRSTLMILKEIGTELALAQQYPQISVIGDIAVKMTSLHLAAEFRATSLYGHCPIRVGFFFLETPVDLTSNMYNSYSYADQDPEMLMKQITANSGPFAYRIHESAVRFLGCDSTGHYLYRSGCNWKVPSKFVSSEELASNPRIYQYIGIYGVWTTGSMTDSVECDMEEKEILSFIPQTARRLLKQVN